MISFAYQFEGAELLPLCEVALLGRSHDAIVRAVIDSGATDPIFPISAAEDAGLRLDRARQYRITFGGSTTESKLLGCDVRVGHQRFHLQIAFVERLLFPYALLGRRGLFNQFNEVAFIENIPSPRVELRR
jgi:hypothetical protein